MDAHAELVEAVLEHLERLLDLLAVGGRWKRARRVLKGRIRHDDPKKALGAAEVVLGMMLDELEAADD